MAGGIFFGWTLLLLFGPPVLLEIILEPACGPMKRNNSFFSDLRVAVIADLHLAGPGTAWVDRMRRESFMQSVLKRAYRKLKPDALVVLGDVSDAGRKSSNEQWEEVVIRFQTLVRPFAGVPLQVVVGNHDVGDHHDINFAKRLPRFAASFHLDSTGSSQSHWKGVDFISLNAMAMRADGCSVCSSVEEIVNRTSSALYGRHGEGKARIDVQHRNVGKSGDPQAVVNNLFGPVLLLHLPLYRHDDGSCDSVDIPRCAPWHDLEGSCIGAAVLPPLESSIACMLRKAVKGSCWRGVVNRVRPLEEPYRVGVDVLSRSYSEHLLQLLKPRLVLSGHTHRWCDLVHADGTREITVPSLSWRNRDDPSFIFATFHTNSSISIQRCMLAHESMVLMIYILWGFAGFSWLLTLGFVAHRRLRTKSLKPE